MEINGCVKNIYCLFTQKSPIQSNKFTSHKMTKNLTMNTNKKMIMNLTCSCQHEA